MLDNCQVVLTLDDWDTYFILQHLMVASSKHHLSYKMDDNRVVSRCRSTNMNNGAEESIISYFRGWLEEVTSEKIATISDMDKTSTWKFLWHIQQHKSSGL